MTDNADNGSSRRSSRKQAPKEIPYRIKKLFHSEGGEPTLTKNLEQIHSNPNVYLVRNFLSEGEIQHFDKICTQRMKKFKSSFVENDDNEEVISSERTSTYTYLGKGQDGIVRGVERKASDLAGMTSEFCEPLQIVSYTAGQKFETHHDAGTLLDDGVVELVPPRRLVTLFLYLNTLPEGEGHTEFPELGMSVKPERGCGVLFSNVLANGEIDSRTVHRARPVRGSLQKYGMNVWLCDMNMQELAMQPKTKKEKMMLKAFEALPFDKDKSALTLANRRVEEYIDNQKSGKDKKKTVAVKKPKKEFKKKVKVVAKMNSAVTSQKKTKTETGSKKRKVTDVREEKVKAKVEVEGARKKQSRVKK